ncbi:hypothetical protein BS629_04525 [Rhizobium leguminosarum bv. viciae USDA 2370]|nr:hypothetical protein BS629_04525 [Rhizobium leguminosarum bv. viciae USDA 2370]
MLLDFGIVVPTRPSANGAESMALIVREAYAARQAAAVKEPWWALQKRRILARQVRLRETSASESLMAWRKVQDDVETGRNSLGRDGSGGQPDFCPAASGMKAARLLTRLSC